MTLVYLAIQVRQNTAALKAASRQAIVAGFREYNRLGLEPTRVDDALRSGLHAYPDLPIELLSPFTTMMSDHTLNFQSAFALYEAGTLEDETYGVFLDFLAAHLVTPGGSAWWEETRSFFPARMAAALDSRIAEGGLPDLLAYRFFRAPDGSSV